MTTVLEQSSAGAAPETRQVQLPAGDLTVQVYRADLPLEAICGFAARRNPRRGFLFVSKVLGRHMPTRPSVMRDVYRRLAAKVPADLPGPVVMIAMAEMAIGLGQGVYDELWHQTGRDDLLFLHSTRFRVNAPLALDFSEEHSHATSHLLHFPTDPRHQSLFRTARSLVLVDDEMSTGSTFVNLAREFALVNPALEQVLTIVITDWIGSERGERLTRAMPAPYRSLSLLAGEYRYVQHPDAPEADMPNVTGNGQDKSALLQRNDGRLGLVGVPAVPAEVVDSVMFRPGERALVTGTGEFAYLPFRLAEEVERSGAQVWCQSTTRSPIMVSHDIGSVLTFADNYDDGIPNFLYNARPGQYDRVVVCYETPERTIQTELVEALAAQAICFPA